MKKIIIFLLSILMFFVCSPVYAAEYNKDTTAGFYPVDQPAFTFEIVEPDDHANHNHKFKIYQVLKGDLYVDGTNEPVLSNIDFGDGVNGTALLAAVKSNPLLQSKFAGVENASEFADNLKEAQEVAQLLASIIGQNVIADKGKQLTSEAGTKSYKYTENNGKLAPGYYIVIDKPEDTTPSARIITAVVGNVKLATKSQSIPEVSKSVADVNDSTLKTNFPKFDKTTPMETIFSFGVNNGDSADHEIGDVVFFTLRAKLPGETGTTEPFTGYRQYNSYKIEFHDTMSKGLTFLGSTFKAAELPTSGADDAAVQDWITQHTGSDGTAPENISNNVRVFVSNDEDSSVPKKEYPIVPKAVYDKLKSYYLHTEGETTVNKYGQLGPVVNSQGKFYKENCFYYVTEVNADGTTSLTIGIDDTMGIARANDVIRVAYNAKLNEQAVVGFQAGNDNKVYLAYSNYPSDTNSVGKTTEDLVRVWTYRLNLKKVDQNDNPLKGADFSLEKLVWNANTQSYDSKTVDAIYGNPDLGAGNYFTRSDFVTENTLNETAFNAKLDENTTFNYIGIDDGHYVLKETRTPHGYNTMKDRYFVVQSTHELSSENPSVTAYSIIEVKDSSFDTTKPLHTYTASADSNGTITFNVENKKGVALPATGGIGTTIFYVGGSILVVAAAVILVTNKKSKNND